MSALAADVTVVGAGLTGAAVAFGLARRGLRVCLLDAHDPMHRLAPSVAALMTQSVRLQSVAAAHLSHLAVSTWSTFDAELADIAGCNAQYRRDGGLHFCLDRAAFEDRARQLTASNADSPGVENAFEMLDGDALHRLIPHLRQTVHGASYCADDARVNPDAVRRALALGLSRLRVDYRPHNRVQWVREQGGEWVVMARGLAVGCGRVVLACGVDMHSLVRPSDPASPKLCASPRSIVQTEPVIPFLPFAGSQINQAGDGSLYLDTEGLGIGSDGDAEAVRARAATLCDGLGRLRIIQQWHNDRVGLEAGGACYQPLGSDSRCWFLASPDSLYFLPVHTGLVADVVAGRVDADALAAYRSVDSGSLGTDAATRCNRASGAG